MMVIDAHGPVTLVEAAGEVVAAANDRGEVVVATPDGCTHIVDTGRPQLVNIDVSADGQRLLTISWRGDVQVWDVPTASELIHLRPEHRWSAPLADLSPDGKQILYGEIEYVRVIDVDSGAARALEGGAVALGFDRAGDAWWVDSASNQLVREDGRSLLLPSYVSVSVFAEGSTVVLGVGGTWLQVDEKGGRPVGRASWAEGAPADLDAAGRLAWIDAGRVMVADAEGVIEVGPWVANSAVDLAWTDSGRLAVGSPAGLVLVLDPATDQWPGTAVGAGFSRGIAWSLSTGGTLSRVDLETGQSLPSLALGTTAPAWIGRGAVSWAGGVVWSDSTPGPLSVDPRGAESPWLLAPGLSGTLIYGSHGDGSLAIISDPWAATLDPDGRLVGKSDLRVFNSPFAVGPGGRTLVFMSVTGAVQRVDMRTDLRTTLWVGSPGQTPTIEVDAREHVWLVQADGSVLEIDTEGTVTERRAADASEWVVAADMEWPWIATVVNDGQALSLVVRTVDGAVESRHPVGEPRIVEVDAAGRALVVEATAVRFWDGERWTTLEGPIPGARSALVDGAPVTWVDGQPLGWVAESGAPREGTVNAEAPGFPEWPDTSDLKSPRALRRLGVSARESCGDRTVVMRSWSWMANNLLWSTAPGGTKLKPLGSPTRLNGTILACDAQGWAVGLESGELMLGDWEGGEPRLLPGRGMPVSDLFITPEGLLVAQYPDGVARVWRGEELVLERWVEADGPHVQSY